MSAIYFNDLLFVNKFKFTDKALIKNNAKVAAQVAAAFALDGKLSGIGIVPTGIPVSKTISYIYVCL